MVLFIWIMFTTTLGSAIGHYGFDGMSFVGAIIGLIIGLITGLLAKLRAAAEVFESLADIFCTLD